MSLNLEEKKQVVEHVSAVLEGSQAAIVAEYRGLSVAEMSTLRREAHEAGVYLKVVKNTLMRRAVDGSDFQCLDDYFVGPVAFAASDDPVAVAKVISKFDKEYDALSVRAGAMSGELLSDGQIKALARLPGREELIAKLMGTLQAPVQTFVRTLNEVPSSLVRVLAAVRDAKQSA